MPRDGEVGGLDVHALDAAVALGLADLATENVQRRLPNLAMRVIERLQHRETSGVIHDRVVEDAQAAMPNAPRRVVHSPKQRGLGVLAAGAKRNDRLLLALNPLELDDTVV